MTEDDEEALLAGLDADDWNIARDAVEVVGDRLRSRKIDDLLCAELAPRFLRLSNHSKWEVRKAIAHAVLFLHHDSFLAVIGPLIDDENAWVREAARKTLRRREGLTRSDLRGDDHGDVILGLLSALEARYGLRARRAAAKVADHLHHRFVSEAYHEISRIIAPLDGFLLNLENDLGILPGISDRTLQASRRAQARVQLIVEFLDNLRAFTIDEPSAFTQETLLPIITEAIDLAVDDDGIGATVQLSVDGSLRVEASRSRLLQAFINIIANAFEACAGQARPGVLAISAQLQSHTHIKITITDNGCGMSEEAVQDCILLYSTGKQSGMGFGLPLAKKIIEIGHHGTLSIKSRMSVGTTVTIMLPIDQLRSGETE